MGPEIDKNVGLAVMFATEMVIIFLSRKGLDHIVN